MWRIDEKLLQKQKIPRKKWTKKVHTQWADELQISTLMTFDVERIILTFIDLVEEKRLPEFFSCESLEQRTDLL